VRGLELATAGGVESVRTKENPMDAKETLKPDPAKTVTSPEQADFPPARDEEMSHAQAHDAGVEAVARALDQVV
jgi:hypothetical protein